MKKLFLVLVLFCFVGSKTAIAQGVRVNFIRYKMINYNSYYSQWDKWPVKWTSSAAYAIISSVYDNTYKVSVYSNAGEHIVTSVCTFNSQLSSQKRRSEGLPNLNCYTDREGDQIWTNVVSLNSLLGDVTSWKEEGAALYLWVFRSSSSFAFVFE
ncbi:hypothetical protein [Runella aurantiaca]|uniref:Uncharacterized protein n=1 Tax=Runella aurantiaca TaxID=2282308 RepID=A0A369IJG3_9BACT|nr:hypothetical protein [Runella aurantiaca]RDB07523.1 hypothetical protein DVG78_00185 [Runella aurantiaca]